MITAFDGVFSYLLFELSQHNYVLERSDGVDIFCDAVTLQDGKMLVWDGGEPVYTSSTLVDQPA